MQAILQRLCEDMEIRNLAPNTRKRDFDLVIAFAAPPRRIRAPGLPRGTPGFGPSAPDWPPPISEKSTEKTAADVAVTGAN